MGFFDDYDILGGLGDLVSTPFKAADKVLFGGPGEVGGIIGTPIKAALDNPKEAAAVVAAVAATGGVALAASSMVSASASAGVAAGIGARALRTYATSEAATAALVASTKISAKQVALYQAAGFVVKQIKSHVVDNYIRETVRPVKGCIIYCDLGFVVEHSGVYVGNGKIVHLDGSGAVELVTQEEFLRRLGGINPALSLYVSCSGSRAIGDNGTARRALAMVGNRREYNLVLDNCHQFTSGCITGDFENSDNFWCRLKNTVEKQYDADSWKVWRSPS